MAKLWRCKGVYYDEDGKRRLFDHVKIMPAALGAKRCASGAWEKVDEFDDDKPETVESFKVEGPVPQADPPRKQRRQ